ncbi:MAG: carbamoyltransferase HypF [Dongiaceae bacterium]
MMRLAQPARPIVAACEVRVRGQVQGVGFRPTVWRLAHACGLTGQVRNDPDGVLIQLEGAEDAIARFLDHLPLEAPPLSRIEAIERHDLSGPLGFADFAIVQSTTGHAHTPVTPDAAICPACKAEILSPFERRFRYPFANCTHCGPRFSIVRSVPYDRASTSMAAFAMCPACAAEYGDPADRRFHAQPVACHVCGPRATLQRFDGRAVSYDQYSMLDDVDAVAGLLLKGEIVAIKGLGGFHLACDATNAGAVARLRARKRRYRKPFALMARDLEIVRRYCSISAAETDLLASAEAPIVLLEANGPERLPDEIAPGFDTLGFMLPYTPLHVLLMRRLSRPVVMTSGNLSEEPQVIANEDALGRLGSIADYILLHNRDIENRIDDSVVRIMAGAPRLLRRARGYAPAQIKLPKGFEGAPEILAFGGELKATFCLVKDDAAILSQHQGDLEDAATFDDYQKNLRLYEALFTHRPELLAADLHPDYLSTKLARAAAQERGLPLTMIQHHHAHIASCLAENARPIDTPPVLGVALDGLGYGEDGAIWGGEFLVADYCSFRRAGTFKPVAMIGGAQAIREPWRNTYAHLAAEMGWARFAINYDELDLYAYLADKPRDLLDRMVRAGINAPLASSCGRLFDAVAAAVGLCRDLAAFEGEGAMLLEAAIDKAALHDEDEALAYPFAIPQLKSSDLPYIEPLAMWQALLGDMILKTPVPIMAARFHRGLARAIAGMVAKLAQAEANDGIDTVALSGGCFQNRTLLEETERRLRALDYKVLTQSRVPANDGGLALGQAAVAAARAIRSGKER